MEDGEIDDFLTRYKNMFPYENHMTAKHDGKQMHIEMPSIRNKEVIHYGT